MKAYKPPEKSMLQKLAENLFVQLTLVIFVGLIAILVITRNQKQSFWTRVHFLRGPTVQISQSDEVNQFSTGAEPTEQASSQQPPAASNQPLATRSAVVKAKTASTTQTKIYYLEIPNKVLRKWLEEGALTRVETSEGVTIGYIPQLKALMDKYQSEIKVLSEEDFSYSLNHLYTAKYELPTETKPASPTQPTSLPERSLASQTAPTQNSQQTAQATQQSPAPFRGFITYATLDDDRHDSLTGQLEVSTGPQVSFPAQFEMTPDQAFFISGFDRNRRGRQPANREAPSETVVVLKIDK